MLWVRVQSHVRVCVYDPACGRHFGEVFMGVCKLVGDSDLETKNGAHLLGESRDGGTQG
jgi:hypothetical protein